jgi:hypothetical protein
VGLAFTVIGILPQDHHLYPVKRGALKSIKNEPAWRVEGVFLFLFHQKLFERSEIRRLELVHKDRLPTLLNERIDCLHGMKVIKVKE